MSLNPEDVVVIPRGVRVHHDKVRDNMVLLAPERAINLDPIGQAILEAIDGERDFQAITAHLSELYNAPVEQISGDCSEFISSLMDRRILEVRT